MITTEMLIFFARYIEAEIGIVYADHNYFQLQNRLEEIARQLAFSDVEQLFRATKNGMSSQVKQLLLDSATNNETSFFRDPKIFVALERLILGSAKKNVIPTKLKIWSAASSTGQEALSISIMIHEFNHKSGVNVDFSILGTDISERVLARAKAGIYSQLELDRGLAPNLVKKYFTSESNERRIANSLVRKNIEFRKLNLKEPFSLDNRFHLVLCRNMLIYQSNNNKKLIIERLVSSLEPGGYLLLGSGESLLGISSSFDQHCVEGAIVYQLKDLENRAAA